MTRRRSRSRNTSTRRPKTTRRGSRWWRVGLPVFGSLFLICGLGVVYLQLPGPEKEHATSLYVERSTPLGVLMEQLAGEGLVRQPRLFELYLRVSGQASRIVAGAHFFKAGLNPITLAACLSRSGGRPKVSVTIPEGFDQIRVAARLQTLGVCSSADFLAASSSASVLAELSINGPSAEGYLFPLTYALPIDSDPRELLRLWVAETRRRLDAISRAHGDGLLRLKEQRGWGEHEVLTLASIVEKESPRDDERRTVASVFFNRLDDAEFRPRRMLQSDPTAYYGCLVSANRYAGCEANPGHVVPPMLRDPQNPYNTYRHAGLPPGPISNPSAGSIAAVIDPEQTDFLFFVAKNGRHVFSRTLAEHQTSTRRVE